jgi:predicted transcriptional regulator
VVTPGRDRGTQRQLTVYLEPETAAQLAELAAREDRPVAYIARRIIREFFGD